MPKKEKNSDCAIKLLKIAHTQWQKAVAVQLVEQENHMKMVVNDVKWLKWLVTSVLIGTVIAGIIFQYFSRL